MAAFVSTAERGPFDAPIVIKSFADYERQFGGLSAAHLMSYSVSHFYRNGGTSAVIVRLKGKKAAPAAPDPGIGSASPDGGFDDDSYGTPEAGSGLYALVKADIFNMLVLPPLAPGADVSRTVLDRALIEP